MLRSRPSSALFAFLTGAVADIWTTG